MTPVRLETHLAALLATALMGLLSGHASAQEGGLAGTVAGIEWAVPEGWTKGKGSSMRVATYVVPAAEGAEPGECAVFYFGRGQGGGVDDNVRRWARQFKENPTPGREERVVNGIGTTLVDVEGTYLNPGGGSRLLQVHRPQGNGGRAGRTL